MEPFTFTPNPKASIHAGSRRLFHSTYPHQDSSRMAYPGNGLGPFVCISYAQDPQELLRVSTKSLILRLARKRTILERNFFWAIWSRNISA